VDAQQQTLSLTPHENGVPTGRFRHLWADWPYWPKPYLARCSALWTSGFR